MSDVNGNRATSINGLAVGVDSFSLDPTTSHRKLRSIGPDGTLTYDETKTPETKLTETLGRIWSEYPGGMLDITESALEAGSPDELAVKEPDEEATRDTKKAKGGLMTFEEMGILRETVLDRLNAARNEMWYLFELAKTLQHSTPFTSTPPPPPTFVPVPTPKKQKGKPKAEEPKNAAALIHQTDEPPVLPPGTFSTTPSLPPTKATTAEVIELEIALAAKQAALEECSKMVDNAVEELTTMADAGERFWADVRRLKDGRRGRGQWAVVPKPDFGRVMGEEDKAKDIIIPYSIDEASAATRARCLAAFDLDPLKKELAFGARNYLRLKVTLTDPNGMTFVSAPPVRISDDADVSEKMEEASLEAFDEDLFAEIRTEVLRRGTGVVEVLSTKFDVGEQSLSFELIDTRNKPSTSGTLSPLCDFALISCRLSLLQLLRARKRRLISGQPEPTRPPSVLASLVHILQYHRLAYQINEVLNLLAKTVSSLDIDCRVITRLSLDQPEVIVKMLEESGSTENIGGIYTLEIDGSRGIMINTSAPSNLTITTSKATFPLSDPSELISILSEDVSLQLLDLLVPVVRDVIDGKRRDSVFIDELEEAIIIPETGSLRLSIPPPYESVRVQIESEDRTETFESRAKGDLREWLKDVVSRPQIGEDVDM